MFGLYAGVWYQVEVIEAGSLLVRLLGHIVEVSSVLPVENIPAGSLIV